MDVIYAFYSRNAVTFTDILQLWLFCGTVDNYSALQLQNPRISTR